MSRAMVIKNCTRDAAYLQMQKAYCKFLHSSYDYADSILDHIMLQDGARKRKCAVVLDVDGTYISENACADFETFSRAIKFVRDCKIKFGDRITIAIITARQSNEGLIDLFREQNVDDHITAYMYDINQIGTIESKIQNRALLRQQGYTIVMSIGDGIYDLVPDTETRGTNTANILLSNLYRLRIE